ncbi:hypothetical protein SORBI_3006G013000 [Sorghum bicolor]|uniref:Succinate dehydrogenase subunit 3 n=1 Tax=Sorghum bicolor TaxID=4558 RepID=A0A1Z5RBI6_SORBI|nr:hypothetical protein SORBI_3006G013000 [Sorghum bicolor]
MAVARCWAQKTPPSVLPSSLSAPRSPRHLTHLPSPSICGVGGEGRTEATATWAGGEQEKPTMEKCNSNARFAPLSDTPFALRGALGSTSSNLEQTRGYASSPLAAQRPKISAPGSRPLHTSRPLSSPVANRPLSPHLPLKKPQFSATFSISHRIFGVALGVAIISVPLATKFSLMFGV